MYCIYYNVVIISAEKYFKESKMRYAIFIRAVLIQKLRFGSYYKSKLELKLNSSEILPVNCKFICVHIFLFCAKSQT